MLDVERFLQAHELFYETALKEIKNGRKRSHWIWYIFPQLKNLGQSRNSQYYGIENLADAKEYLADETLRSHLLEISQALLELDTNDAVKVMGEIDSKKLLSCMTLFHLAEPTCETFTKVIEKYFDGNLDIRTVELCKKD